MVINSFENDRLNKQLITLFVTTICSWNLFLNNFPGMKGAWERPRLLWYITVSVIEFYFILCSTFQNEGKNCFF